MVFAGPAEQRDGVCNSLFAVISTVTEEGGGSQALPAASWSLRPSGIVGDNRGWRELVTRKTGGEIQSELTELNPHG